MNAPSSLAAVSLLGILCQPRDTTSQGHGRPSENIAKGNGVGAYAEYTPFLGYGLGEASDGRLSCGIVRLTYVTVQSGRRRYVDDGAVLAPVGLLQSHIGRRGTDEAEWRADMNSLNDVPRIVRHGMQHTVVGEAS